MRCIPNFAAAPPQADAVDRASLATPPDVPLLLAMGRRGTPRKLNVPGEDLAKVAYQLVDAEAYRGRRVLVVGGGIGTPERGADYITVAASRILNCPVESLFFETEGAGESHSNTLIENNYFDSFDQHVVHSVWRLSVQVFEVGF